MKRTVRLTLNNKKFGSQITVEGVHVGDDNSCELAITIADGNRVLDITDGSTVATMSGAKPDGTVISRSCTIFDNTVYYTLDKQDTAIEGNVLYQITVASDNGIAQSVIATAKFTVAVMKNIYVPIYRLLSAEPPDWSSNYKSYFRLINNRYTAISDSACPAFTENAFYNLVNPNYDSKDDYTAFHSALARTENLIGRASDILIEVEKKANISNTLSGYGITDAYTKSEADTALSEKVTTADLADKLENLLDLQDYYETKNGVELKVENNLITLTGVSTATFSFFVPLKKKISIEQDKPLSLSMHNFSTKNAGEILYLCNGSARLEKGSWLLVAASAINGVFSSCVPSVNAASDVLEINIAVSRTVDNSFNVQLERGLQKTDYIPPGKPKLTLKNEVFKEAFCTKDEMKSSLAEKLNIGDIAEKVENLIDLKDYSETKNGVELKVENNLITLSGTSASTFPFYIPLKKTITLERNKPLALSIHNFTTANDGGILYICRGNTNIDSSWLLVVKSAINGGCSVYTPTHNALADTLKINIAASKTVNNSFNVQLEKGDEKTEYIPCESPRIILRKEAVESVLNASDKMNYIYVSKSYTSNDEGFGKNKFNTIYEANQSITDNNSCNRYTIIVKPGIYDDLQQRYAGKSDASAVELAGIICKDYVYYESENIFSPQDTVIKWNGITGFTGTVTKDDIIKKCPFHITSNKHTHIKGFTFETKNLRYGIHIETGGNGYNSDWEVGNCIFRWGGRPDVEDYANNTSVPVFGCGHSICEKGRIHHCKIETANCTVGYQNHENPDNSNVSFSVKGGAEITIDNCDFGGTEVQVRTLTGYFAETNNVVNIENCINIASVQKKCGSAVDRCDWIVNTKNCGLIVVENP